MKYHLPLVLLVALLPVVATAAGTFELSGSFGFSRSNYSETNFEWSRRWGASIGYHFTERSGIEVGYQGVTTRSHIADYGDTEFHDRIYGIDWVQDITGRNFPVQPYAKLGVAQINRDATAVYVNGLRPALTMDSVSVNLAAGLRIYLTKNFAIRAEATSYLAGGSVRTWLDNVHTTLGTSFFF